MSTVTVDQKSPSITRSRRVSKIIRFLLALVMILFALFPVAWATHVLPVDRLYAHVYPLHAICIGVGLNPLAYGIAAVVQRVGREKRGSA